MKGYVYKLQSPNLQYFGSTFQNLNQRFNSHVHNAIYGKVNNVSRVFQDGEVEVIKLAEIETEDKNTLKMIERYYIENFECVNKNIPLRSTKEADKARRKSQHRIDYLKKYNSRQIKCQYCTKDLIYSSKWRHEKICPMNKTKADIIADH